MSESPIPAAGRLAGIDFGTVRIGVAVSDPGRMLASPLEVYSRRSAEADANYFRQLVEREGIVAFVVGLPVHMSGDESQKSREARAFGSWLGATTGVPVCFHDERFTTSEADEILGQANLRGRKAQQKRDMLAAQRILSGYLQVGPQANVPPVD